MTELNREDFTAPAPFHATITLDLWVWKLADAEEVVRQLLHGGIDASPPGIEHASTCVDGGRTTRHSVRSMEVRRA